MFNWWKKRKVKKLQVELAGLTAEWAEEVTMTQLTGQVFPCVREELAGRIGRVKEQLRQIQQGGAA